MPQEQLATLKIVGPYQIIVALDEVGVKWKSAGSFCWSGYASRIAALYNHFLAVQARMGLIARSPAFPVSNYLAVVTIVSGY
jgi:hypothetical protein